MTRDDIIRMAREAGSIDSEDVIETVWAAFTAAERDESVDLWKQKSDTYMEMMDAIASDADKACALLRWAETEMRYAGWGTRINDQHGRTDVYEAIVDYLYGNSNDIA